MSDLMTTAREFANVLDAGDSSREPEAAREFVESITFASADEITAMLREILAKDWMGLPPWARNLAYRLACLQRPSDAELLREAASDLLAFGPDWDAQAAILKEAATGCEDPLR
ncbi:hypothetical protein OG559_30830 [Micromonospora sp. NBC_01405]|uniref:hypothetical protein n=1 Tax=Micromonospora sp. NBC_01405 TaxID=2903589 RepID=UPI003252FD0F